MTDLTYLILSLFLIVAWQDIDAFRYKLIYINICQNSHLYSLFVCLLIFSCVDSLILLISFSDTESCSKSYISCKIPYNQGFLGHVSRIFSHIYWCNCQTPETLARLISLPSTICHKDEMKNEKKKWKLHYINPRGKYILSTKEQRQGTLV